MQAGECPLHALSCRYECKCTAAWVDPLTDNREADTRPETPKILEIGPPSLFLSSCTHLMPTCWATSSSERVIEKEPLGRAFLDAKGRGVGTGWFCSRGLLLIVVGTISCGCGGRGGWLILGLSGLVIGTAGLVHPSIIPGILFFMSSLPQH